MPGMALEHAGEAAASRVPAYVKGVINLIDEGANSSASNLPGTAKVKGKVKNLPDIDQVWNDQDVQELQNLMRR